MKNVMIAIAFIATVALASCGGNAPESTATATDSCKVATDSTSVDTTAVSVDTTTTK
jgi:hypothetical protein